MLTFWWFIVNLIFVTLFIVYLFSHRAYKEAEQAGDAALVLRRKSKRRVFGLLALAAFVATSALFMANMYYNG